MIKFLLVPLLVIVISYFIFSGFKYTRMISNIFLGLVYTPPHEVLVSSVGERITVLDSADREIEALLVEKKGSEKMLIFCHESGATKESWEKYAYFFPGLGFSVLSVDFSAKPDNPQANTLSQWPSGEDVERLLTVIRWAKKAFRPGIRIALFGVSKGANIALAASFQEPSVSVVIADGLFSMKEIFRDYIRKWAPILVRPNFFGEVHPRWAINLFTNLGFWYCQKQCHKEFLDIEKMLKKNHVPLLMIHGESDDYIPPTHQKFLEKIDRGGKRLARRLVVPKAGHNESVVLARELYEDQVKSFLEGVM